MTKSTQSFIGTQFGDLTVLSLYLVPRGSAGVAAKCVTACSCGKVKDVWKHNLTSGHTLSCGCLQKRRTSAAKITHGHTVGSKKNAVEMSPTYTSWASMKWRCGKAKHYANVSYDPRWDSFENFLADMGERPEGHTIDRKDPLGNYEPDNCRWATPKQQSANRTPWKHTPEGIAKIRVNLPNVSA